MRRQLAAIIMAGLSLISLSCGRDGEANTVDPPAVRAHTEILQLTKLADYFQAPGSIRAKTSTVLSSIMAGQVLSVGAREGDRVHQGQIVVEIDGRDASARLRRAQAAASEAHRARDEAERSVKAADAAVRVAEVQRNLAASTKNRYDVLRERKSVSPQEYDEVETKYKAASLEVERSQEGLLASKAHADQVLARIEQAAAEIDAAQVALGYSRVTAPIDGVVTARSIEPGMLAAPGTPLLAIEDDRTYQLEVMVEESRATTIHIGQAAPIEIDGLAGSLDGRVAEIVPVADPATRTYIVKLAFTPPGADRRTGVRSGFFGKAMFPYEERQALLVPRSAVVHRGQLDGVYMVQNDRCVFRLIKTGRRYADRIEILSGLDAGAQIVVAPDANISDGVKIVEDAAGVKMP